MMFAIIIVLFMTIVGLIFYHKITMDDVKSEVKNLSWELQSVQKEATYYESKYESTIDDYMHALCVIDKLRVRQQLTSVGPNCFTDGLDTLVSIDD